MGLHHSILKDAVEYAFHDQTVKHHLDARDINPQLSIKEIKARVAKIEERRVLIQIVVNYEKAFAALPAGEDVQINLSWSNQLGFKLISVQFVSVP
jgi:hypothetical protein